MQGVTLRRIPSSAVPVLRIHYTADPTMTPERVAALRSKYTSDARWRREMEIEYEALEGERLYPEYSPEMNDCEPFDVSDPSRWTIWMGADPHGRTPHAFVWVAFNPEGEAVICGELWPRKQFTVREYAETIEWIESDSHDKPLAFEWADGKPLRVHKRVMDTFGANAYHFRAGHTNEQGVDFFDAYKKQGLSFYPANKSHLGAVRDEIGELMVPSRVVLADKETLVPRLRLFRTCTEMRSELENVRYPEGETERPSDEKPQTYHKHAIDCLHYVFSDKPRFVMVRGQRGDGWKPLYEATGY